MVRGKSLSISLRTTAFLLVMLVGCATQVVGGPPTAAIAPSTALDADDDAYLRVLAVDTWACIAHFVEPSSGLPFDTSERAEFTSVSNLGMYAAACGVAAEMKLVSAEDATTRVRRVLDAYERFQKWNGFSQSWNSVRTLKPSPTDTMVSVLDSANMAAGLIVAAQALPDVREQVERILTAMDWSAVYDPEKKLLFGGYDLAQGKLDPEWRIGSYATDGRMAAFLAIAVGAAPPDSWDALGRETEQHYGLTIYRPAWAGGGLFMQALHGLFLDERSTPIGRSMADFAYSQMMYAKQFDLPLWGWSACLAPDGRYLGWGGLETPVVTPHAVGLAAMYYPHKGARCLRQLEQFGARQPHREDGKLHKFGFSDSVNFETRAVQRAYLVPLDQGMLFLSLANLLEDRVVQRLFEGHPVIKRGRNLIAEYSTPVDARWLAELRRRDREPLPTPASTARTGPDMILIDDFESGEIARNRLGGKNHAWTRNPADTTVKVVRSHAEVQRNGRTTGCLKIAYDVDSANPAFGGVTMDLQHANGSGCTALELWIRGQPASLKIELHGTGGIGVTYVQGISADQWRSVRIPFLKFGGLISDWSDLEQLIFVFEDGRSKPRAGVLLIDEARLTR